MTAQNGNPAGGDTPDGARSNRNTREQTSPKLFCNASGRLFHEEIKAIEREWARGNMDVASDNDRAWFEANPTRRYRLRGPLPGEHWHWRGDLTRASAVLVHSLAPGVRVRTPITLTLPLVLCRDDEATAKKFVGRGGEMTDTPNKTRKQLRVTGYAPVPVQGKHPPLESWQTKIESNDGEIDLWSKSFPNAKSTGLLTRSMPTFDIDIRNPEAAAAVEDLVRQRFGERGIILVRIGNAPKRAIPFRTNTPFKKNQISFDVPKGHPEEKLELLGDGQQVVAFGIHPDTGKPYQWIGGEPGQILLRELPLITEDEAKQLVIDAAELLAQFGYNRRGKKKKANGDDDKLARLLQNIHDGNELHDSLRDAAAVLVAAGMADQAVVTKLRSAMETSKAPRDTRWQDRYDEIEKLVTSAQEKFGTDERLVEMNEKFCVVPFGGKAVILMFEEVERPHGPGKRHLATFFRAGDFKMLFDNQKVKPGSKLGLATWWLNQKARRQYAGVTFRPGKEHVVGGRLNLWRGWGVQPKAGDWSLMHRHIVEVLAGGNESYANYILNWTAWALQNPSLMAEVALVFKGKKGVGKGVYVRALLNIFGQHGLHISSMKQLTGQFNAHLMDCALLYADEAYWPGDKSAEGTLKHLITEPQIAVEKKNYDIVSADNVLKLIMAGNEDWQVPASMDERRYAVFEVSSAYAGSRDYFVPLFKQTFEDGGLQAMMFDLLHRDLGDWHPRYDVPQTAALQEQKALSLKPEDQWWLHLLDAGTLPHNSPENPRRARSQALNEAAKRDIPGLKFYSPQRLGKALRKHGCVPCQIDHNKGWEFPPLAEARAKFDSDMGGSSTDWSEQEDWQVEEPVWANDAMVTGYLHKESPPKDGHQGAWLLSRDADKDKAEWFPKSQIKLRHLPDRSKKDIPYCQRTLGDRVEITPAAWFAEKEEWKAFTRPEVF